MFQKVQEHNAIDPGSTNEAPGISRQGREKKSPTARKKRCKFCREVFSPERPLQSCCGWKCASSLVAKQREKARQDAEKKQRREDKAKREKLKPRSDYMKEAQIAFNAFIRLRDGGKPCICCGQPLESGAIGGSFDCGHYRSVGSAPHLRFDERNAHGQRKQCNRYGAGRAVDYRLGLISRIGLAAVVALESDNEPRKYSIEELKGIRDHYRMKLKQLRKGNQIGN